MRERQSCVMPPLRREFAELLRHFGSGRLTNDEMMDALHRLDQRHRTFGGYTGDAGVAELDSEIDGVCDSTSTFRLTGRNALNRQSRRYLARLILFLHTDQPYRVQQSGCLSVLVPRCLRRDGHIPARWDERSIWPFATRADYENALRHPPLLNGHVSPTNHP